MRTEYYHNSVTEISKISLALSGGVSVVTAAGSLPSCKQCELAVLGAAEYQQLLEADPSLARAVGPWAMLATVPLFLGASMALRETLVARLSLEQAPMATEVMKQGDAVDRLCFIVTGECRVQVDGMQKKRLKRSDFFGEGALLPADDEDEEGSGTTANATVKTLTSCDFLVLTRSDCRVAQQEHPELEAMLEMHALGAEGEEDEDED